MGRLEDNFDYIFKQGVGSGERAIKYQLFNYVHAKLIELNSESNYDRGYIDALTEVREWIDTIG